MKVAKNLSARHFIVLPDTARKSNRIQSAQNPAESTNRPGHAAREYLQRQHGLLVASGRCLPQHLHVSCHSRQRRHSRFAIQDRLHRRKSLSALILLLPQEI